MKHHPSSPDYAPFYCEENIWRLAATMAVEDAHVWLISNPSRQALCAWQRAGHDQAVDDQLIRGVIVWDYHVVLATNDSVWDLDTLLPFPCSRNTYLESSFPLRGRGHQAPMVRMIPAGRYQTEFASDRRHMRDEAGRLVQPPPPWPPIRGPEATTDHVLPQLLSFGDDTFGPWFDIDGLVRHLQP